jgi:hypothetical protein
MCHSVDLENTHMNMGNLILICEVIFSKMLLQFCTAAPCECRLVIIKR